MFEAPTDSEPAHKPLHAAALIAAAVLSAFVLMLAAAGVA
jgi:hypothetical protein